MTRPYQIGEVVLLQWQGWLKAFRVVGARKVSDVEIEYQMTMLNAEEQSAPQWTKPDA